MNEIRLIKQIHKASMSGKLVREDLDEPMTIKLKSSYKKTQVTSTFNQRPCIALVLIDLVNSKSLSVASLWPLPTWKKWVKHVYVLQINWLITY